LVSDFETAIENSEALLKATASHGGDKLAELRTKTEKSLKAAKAGIEHAQTAVIAKTKEAAHVTDVYVHDHPWKSVGTAAAIGVVIGLLIGRR
jgi:ElaB/YqjD/DUF883 family membrane-anchored ribosome-binding protein